MFLHISAQFPRSKKKRQTSPNQSHHTSHGIDGLNGINEINHMFQYFFDIRRVDVNNNGQPIAIKRAIKALINIDGSESFVS